MIDGCFVINLQDRTDRLELFQRQKALLNSLGLDPERIEAVNGRNLPGYGERPWFTSRITPARTRAWGGKAGCTLSHRQAISLAKARGWRTVLILEDDVSFGDDIASQWVQLMDMMKSLPENWVAVYLFGNNPVPPIRVIQSSPDANCYEIGGAKGTVAYIVNGKYFDELLRRLPTQLTIWSWAARHKTVDRWYSRQMMFLGRVFAVAPLKIGHRATRSDATTSGVPYQVPNFPRLDITDPLFYNLTKFISVLKNRVALMSSIVRQWWKRLRGL